MKETFAIFIRDIEDRKRGIDNLEKADIPHKAGFKHAPLKPLILVEEGNDLTEARNLLRKLNISFIAYNLDIEAYI